MELNIIKRLFNKQNELLLINLFGVCRVLAINWDILLFSAFKERMKERKGKERM